MQRTTDDNDTRSLLAVLQELQQQGRIAPSVCEQFAAKLNRLNDLETKFATALERAKLASLKELAYGASHEINNPLANISTRAQALLVEEKHPERRKKLATIVAQAFRAHEMISDLMLFAKPPTLNVEKCELNPLLTKLVDEALPEAKEQQTELSFEIDPPELTLTADPTHLAVAIKALIRNAVEALGQGGNIVVAATSEESEVVISVIDDGPGISPQVREHLFDPFYSGREAGRGLGFGLSKCWRIAELHGGRIEVESEPGHGATFRLILPDSSAQTDFPE
jgi:signal transduction histidine kinase